MELPHVPMFISIYPYSTPITSVLYHWHVSCVDMCANVCFYVYMGEREGKELKGNT